MADHLDCRVHYPFERIRLDDVDGVAGGVTDDDFSLYPASCGPSAAGVGFEMGEPGVREAPMLPGLDLSP